MRSGWTEAALGEVLVPRTETCAVLQDVEYREVTVSLWGKGVRLRRRVAGAGIAAPFRNVARRGDFIISKIDARNGAFGFIPDDLDGAVVSNDFPLFEVHSERLSPRWLYWISQSHFFTGLCKAASAGSTNRVRLDEGKFRELPIPLPPLAEQQRIVARLDAIETRLNRVQQLRVESHAESLSLLRSLLSEPHCRGIRHVPVSELVTWRAPDTVVSQSESYTFAGVYSFGRGVFRKESISGMNFAYDRLTRLRAGEFTYPKLMAWEGALGVVPENCDGCFVSPEFPVFTVHKEKVLPSILDIHFKTPAVWKALAALSPGTNLRRRRLNPNEFLSYQFPLPPMGVQLQVEAVAKRLAKACREREAVEASHTALLPSLLDQVFNP